jgi:hypothetical protein
MAFCNSCGATLDPSTKFCNKCGAATGVTASAPPVMASASGPGVTAGSAQSGSALKVILIVVAVVVIVGILGVATLGIVTWHIAKRAHVRQNGDHVKVETPFGTVESGKDPDEAARNLGVDVYPGAEVLKGSASTAAFGGMRTSSANFESSDSFDKVASFYKAKYPKAMVSTSDDNECTIVVNDSNNVITISIQASGGRTKIQIANVSQKSNSSSSSD